ncbi:hypothetical protein BGAL_0025g00350 [Botrytis galanthina]|uniref:acylphosphatase n=1 Tax=Botrytis galanthina TaxID=278940 RepID=A0A4S8RDB5_9HELO|nr:hypothetical protein BGAL_0025g00350 [Botrytis galanthina]
MDHEEKLDKRRESSRFVTEYAFGLLCKGTIPHHVHIVIQEALLTIGFSGVSFRWFTQKKARSLGLVGWVRNTDDGKVKGEAQGSASQIESLRADLKEGPPHANVTGYEEKELDLKGKGVAEGRFEVLR